MLIGEGYQVVHLIRHSSFEEGKDVLAIAPDGTPCAFQLKGVDGKKISQREWAKYIEQIIRLVEIPIKHPSIDESKNRRVYFVANGELDEEVRVEITNRNSDWKRRQCPELSTILKGELLARFKNIHTNLWPLQLKTEKDLLELFLADGTGYLDKAKYARFLEDLIFGSEKTTEIEGQRILASASLFASYALSPFTQAENYIAIIEGWTIFLSCALSYVERYQLNEKYWKNTIQIIEKVIEISLSDLWEEVKTQRHYVAGNPLVDYPFYRGRITWIASYLSAYMILQKMEKREVDTDGSFKDFILSVQSLLILWGEAAVPQFLSIYWTLMIVGLSHVADRLLFELYKGILDTANSKIGIFDPYHSLGEIILFISGLSDKLKEEYWSGRSYSMDSIIQLLVRRKYRGVLAENWKQTTYLHFVEFEPNNRWEFYLWYCENGIFFETMPKAQQSWKLLVDQSNEINFDKIPTYFQNHPAMLLIFIMVYPHRLCPNVIKFLDHSILSD